MSRPVVQQTRTTFNPSQARQAYMSNQTHRTGNLPTGMLTQDQLNQAYFMAQRARPSNVTAGIDVYSRLPGSMSQGVSTLPYVPQVPQGVTTIPGSVPNGGATAGTGAVPGFMFTDPYVGSKESEWVEIDRRVGLLKDVANVNSQEVTVVPIVTTHTRDQQFRNIVQQRVVDEFDNPVVYVSETRSTPVTTFSEGTTGEILSSTEIIKDFSL